MPGLKVVAPATAYDAKGLLKAAVRDDNPVLIFEHKLLYGSKGARTEKGALSPVGEVPDEDYIVPIGKGIVRRAGQGRDHRRQAADDVPRAGRGRGAGAGGHRGRGDRPAHAGAARQGADPASRCSKTGRLVIVEEDNLTGGWAGELAALMADEAFFWLDAPIKRVSAPDVPPPFAPVMEQPLRAERGARRRDGTLPVLRRRPLCLLKS